MNILKGNKSVIHNDVNNDFVDTSMNAQNVPSRKFRQKTPFIERIAKLGINLK